MGSKKRRLTAKPWERWHDGKVHGAEAIVDGYAIESDTYDIIKQ